MPPFPDRPHWTSAGTLLLAIAPQAWPMPAQALRLDGLDLQRKRELHATIVGTALGARVRKAMAGDDTLQARIDATTVGLAWRWRRCHAWALIGTRKGMHCRQSLVEWIELPAMADFHQRLGELLDAPLPVPPPHVTLYTRAGGKGIGIPDAATLARLQLRAVDAVELRGVVA